jgi:hypothetical protein
LVNLLADFEGDGSLQVFFWHAQTIDAAHRGHHNHIPPFKQGAGSRVPQHIDFIVDRGRFGDVSIGAGNIGFRLVIVVIADEVFDGIIGKQLS